MEETYHLQAWQNLFLMVGTAAAALAGLILVAVSLHIQNLQRSPISQRRAFNNLLGLGVIIIISALVLTPQSTSVLGIEVLVINAVWVCGPMSVFFRFRRQFDIQNQARVLAGASVCLLGIVSGLCLLLGTNYSVFIGMYALGLSSMLCILFVILNAWAMMMGLYTDVPAAQSTSSSQASGPARR